MKRLFTIALIVLFITSNGFAQINKGIVVGVTLPNLSVDPEPEGSELKNYQGLVGGVFIELDLLGPLDLQAEVLYSQKGAKQSIGGNELKARLNYIVIPVMVKYKMPLVPTLGLNIQGGAYLGQKLDESWDPEMDMDEDMFKNSDMGAVVGVGVQFKAFISDIRVEARYTMGFKNISKEDEGTAKNKNMTVLVGIGF